MSLKTHPSKTLEIQIRQAAQENDQTVSQWLVEASRQKLQLENSE